MFPSRALLGDLIPAEEQHSVQSAAAVVASLAEICAGAYIFSWKDPVTHVSRVFVVASILLAVTCSVSLFVCHEEPLRQNRVVTDPGSSDVERSQLAQTATDEEERCEKEMLSADEHTNGLREKEKTQESLTDDNSARCLDDGNDEAVENMLSVSPPQSTDVAADEHGAESQEGTPNLPGLSVWRELVTTVQGALLSFPRPLIKVGIVYGLAWFVWFASLPYYSQWLGVDVLGGNPHAAPGSQDALTYQRGVSLFSLANVAKALVAMAFSAFYPSIIKWVGGVGERVVFGTSFLAFSVVLFKFAYTKSVIMAMLVIAFGSVPFIVTQTIPIAIVVQRFPENLASNLGIL